MNHTLSEIQNQPDKWRQTLTVTRSRWREIESHFAVTPLTHFLFIGCGTSYYLAQSAARAFQQVTGCVATAVAASEVFLAGDSTIPRNVPVVAIPISRSGTTSEVLFAVTYLQQYHDHVKILGLTCHEDHELAAILPHSISLGHAAEQSIVMTQSFTSMLLALQFIAASIAQRDDLLAELERLPDLMNDFMASAEAFGRRVSQREGSGQYIFLGLGVYTGLAFEAMLKLKEMTQTPCEAYNPLEFRHGPISIVDQKTAVIALAGDEDLKYVTEVVSDIRGLGGYTWLMAPRQSVNVADETLSLPGGLSDWARAILYMPALHYFAYHKAVGLGLNPDGPRHLDQVVVIQAQ